MARRRRSSRSAAAAVCLAALATSGATLAPAADVPHWDGHADASVLHVTVNTRPAAVPVDTLLDVQVPNAASTWQPSGTGTARASLLYPGATGESGLQLLCDFGLPCPEGFPPDYPLTAHADGTTAPDATTPTGAGEAHVRDAEVTSSAAPTDVGEVLAPLGEVVDAASLSTSTRQHVVHGEVVVTARSRVTGLSLGQGTVTIDVVESRAEVHASTDDHAATAELRVAGVRTAAGEVLVGDDGLVVAGEGGGGDAVDQLNAQLAEALADQPVALKVLPATTGTTDKGVTTARVRGLAIRLTPEPSGPSLGQLPDLYRTYVVEGAVGETSARVQRTTGIQFSPLPAPSPSVGDAPSIGTAGPATTPRTSAPSTAGSPLASSGSAPSAGSAEAPEPQVAPPDQPAPSGTATEAGPQLLAGDATTGADRAYLGLVALVASTFVLSRLGARRLTRPRTRA